jgi:hypothetical protein
MGFGPEIRVLAHRPVLRCLALVILLTGSIRIAPLYSTVLDADIWWHLRGGDTIVAQHAVPHRGVFSQHSERPWVEYRWGFEVLASRFYRWFGLMGLVAFRATLQVIISATLFVILLRGLRSFWQAWALTAFGMWAIHHCFGMQPMLISIAMFTFVLALVFEARRRRTIRPLLILPFLFLIWANLHIQFVYGILVLGLLSGVGLVRAILPSKWSTWFQPDHELPLTPVLAVTGLSFLATFIGPYSWQLYGVLLGYLRSSVPYAIITELQALSFRYPEHFVLVLILAGAFFALGWRRSRDPFKLALLVVCTLVGFRMTRDSWFACLPALAIIADRDGLAAEERTRRLWPRTLAFAAATTVVTAAVFALIAWDSKVNNVSLIRVVGAKFPLKACEFIRSRSLPGALYNDMNWGGFVIWDLPEKPVAIDNRTDLYGDEILGRFYSVQTGQSDWRSDPDLNAASIVLLYRQLPLATLLAQDERFHLVYEDPVAVVFTRDATNVSRNSGLPSQEPELKKEISFR